MLRGFYIGAALLLVQAGLVNSPAAAGGSAVLQWLQIALSAASLAMIIFASLKVINRNNEEWRDRERRMVALEQELLELRKEGKEVIAIGAQMSRLEEEMTRLRDRLDRFLDSQIIVATKRRRGAAVVEA